MRADLLIAQKLNISRNKAQELINQESVLVNDKLVKPSENVAQDSLVCLLEDFYVSRAAYKLKGFLEELDLQINGLNCLDVGSSTGGFTQILLLNNASGVTCVDVGNNQLHESLRNNPKIRLFENTDIRTFKENGFDLVVCDVSFISIRQIITYLIASTNEYLIVLFKPQFEVGKSAKRTKNGVVKDEKLISQTCSMFEDDMARLGLRLIKKSKSVLSGKEGNFEYFYAFRK